MEFPPQGAGIGGIFSNRYVIVSEGGLTSTEVPADSLSPTTRSDTRANPQIALKLDFTIKQDKINITVYTIPPESDPLRYADGHKRQLGAHSARLNEIVDLKELMKIGYQPFTLKIVSAKPAGSTHPTIVSRVPSIQVDLADDDLPGHTPLLLRNLSSRGILAYALDVGGGSSVVVSSYGRTVIAQGATRKEMVALGRSGRMTPHGFVEDPVSRGIVVAAAIFSDGLHEGDDEVAVELKSGQIGYGTQYRRIRPVIDRIIQDPVLDDDARVARIREELHNLSNQPDDATIRAMRSQFPDLPNEVVVKKLTDGLDSARRNIWSGLYSYVHSNGVYPPPSHPPPLAEWWRRYRQDIDSMPVSLERKSESHRVA